MKRTVLLLMVLVSMCTISCKKKSYSCVCTITATGKRDVGPANDLRPYEKEGVQKECEELVNLGDRTDCHLEEN